MGEKKEDGYRRRYEKLAEEIAQTADEIAKRHSHEPRIITEPIGPEYDTQVIDEANQIFARAKELYELREIKARNGAPPGMTADRISVSEIRDQAQRSERAALIKFDTIKTSLDVPDLLKTLDADREPKGIRERIANKVGKSFKWNLLRNLRRDLDEEPWSLKDEIDFQNWMNAHNQKLEKAIRIHSFDSSDPKSWEYEIDRAEKDGNVTTLAVACSGPKRQFSYIVTHQTPEGATAVEVRDTAYYSAIEPGSLRYDVHLTTGPLIKNDSRFFRTGRFLFKQFAGPMLKTK